MNFTQLSHVLIAVFWDDVDVRRFGNIFFREVHDVEQISNVKQIIHSKFIIGNFDVEWMFAVTYDRVAEFSGDNEVG